jgi:hypothetical protein
MGSMTPSSKSSEKHPGPTNPGISPPEVLPDVDVDVDVDVVVVVVVVVDGRRQTWTWTWTWT